MKLASLEPTTEKANYERSYRSMWSDIARARKERDAAQFAADASRNLVIAMQHEFGLGMRAPEDVWDAYCKLRDCLHISD